MESLRVSITKKEAESLKFGQEVTVMATGKIKSIDSYSLTCELPKKDKKEKKEEKREIRLAIDTSKVDVKSKAKSAKEVFFEKIEKIKKVEDK